MLSYQYLTQYLVSKDSLLPASKKVSMTLKNAAVCEYKY